MAGVNIRDLSKRYSINNNDFYALQDINLSLADGSFTTIVGKSGCGKTTLLRLLSGLEKQTDGFIDLIDDTGHGNVRTNKRVGMVFQEPRLMPWLTVKENMLFSFYADEDKEKKEILAQSYLKILGLEKFKDAYPRQISGGMAQRAALGRTLCYNPDIILMDEPFAALDYFTRKNLQEEMVNLFSNQKKTIIFVTHNVEEAIFLGQKVVVMEGGKIVCILPIDLLYPRISTSKEFISIQGDILKVITGINQEAPIQGEVIKSIQNKTQEAFI